LVHLFEQYRWWSHVGQVQSFASVSYEVSWPLQGEMMRHDSYLDRHALLKRAVPVSFM
jgi:hypothetical protein